MTSLVLSREKVRSLDKRAIEDYGVPSIVLMENAGRGAAELLLSLGVSGKVRVCCGKGNNAGDGLVIARHLDNAQANVQVLLFSAPSELSEDAAINYQIVAKARIPIVEFSRVPLDTAGIERELNSADWVVDALFGTGLSGPVRPPFDSIINAINASPGRVFAVDIPSGLDCDTGQPMGSTVRADYTATFVSLKKGFVRREASEWLGQIHVIGIGMPRKLLERMTGE
jgi:NAD(P)H-hydrate epimerase